MALTQGQNLDIALKQQLSLTPQLQQAIKILNMNSQDLHLEISNMLAQNFMLELNDGIQQEKTDGSGNADDADNAERNHEDTPSLPTELNTELDHDSCWEDSYDNDWQDHAPYQDNDSSWEDYHSASPNLHAALSEQIAQMPLPPDVRACAEFLIYHVDADGYLRERIPDLARMYDVRITPIREAVQAIQNCQPIGVGAADLEECLNLQIEALPDDTPHLDTLKLIMQRHFIYISKNPSSIISKLGLSDDEYHAAMRLLKSLDPRPGQHYSSGPPPYVRPEIKVLERHGISYIETDESLYPALSINETYAKLAKHATEQEKTLLQAQLNEARWFISAIDKRADTIRRVAGIIVALQQDFFQEGEKAMQPLTRQKVADMLDIHESTVSRAVNGKYLSCKRGIYELRYFFSTQLEAADGEDQSTTAIKAIIADIISKENPKKPLSDQAITDLLAKQGSTIARRTVAKYREELNIPTSSLRRRH